MKAFIFTLLILSTSIYSYANTYSGTENGLSFSFEFDESWDEIEGHWGEYVYDIEVDPDWNDIEGVINGPGDNNKVDVEIDLSWNEIEGNLPCGKVDYEYDLTWNTIEGVMCGEEFESRYDSDTTTDEIINEWAGILVNELLSMFPEAIEDEVLEFVLKRIKFSKED